MGCVYDNPNKTRESYLVFLIVNDNNIAYEITLLNLDYVNYKILERFNVIRKESHSRFL